jgi:lipoyl(octanoyl) transferase
MLIRWLGYTDYVKSLELQTAAQDEAEPRPTVYGLEHPITITLGRRGDPLKDVVVGFKVLRERNIPVVAVERGGQATLHNPGQLVIYPILPLRQYGLGVKDYVSMLEESTKDLLASYGIMACCKGDEPGLFTIRGKIAFYGVRVSRGITSHGIGLNVSNDLSDFQMIRSCGKATEQFASMRDFVEPPSLQTLFFQWVEIFSQRLQAKSGVSHLLPLTAPASQTNL